MACGTGSGDLERLLAGLLSSLAVALRGELVHPLPTPVEELDATGAAAGWGGQLRSNLSAPDLGFFQILFSEAGTPAQGVLLHDPFPSSGVGALSSKAQGQKV